MKSLDELLIQWQEGSLSSEELKQLNHLLSQPEARRHLVEAFAFNEQIAEALRSEQAQESLKLQAQAYQAKELEEAEPDLFSSKEPPVTLMQVWRSLLLRWQVILPVVICVIGIATAETLAQREVLGRLQTVPEGTTIRRDAALLTAVAKGFPLRDGDEILTPPLGLLILDYSGETTRLWVQASSRVLLNKAGKGKRVELREGALSAVVAPQPEGEPMLIHTPHAIATVLGTSLSLMVNSNSSRLEVMEGAVRLVRRDDEKSISVSSGFYAVVNGEGNLAVRPLIPEPWKSQEIGPTGRPGHASWEGKKCRVAGGSWDSRRGSDDFHFVYQVLDGDGEIRAQVLSFETRDKRTKAGVVIRESLKSTAPTAFLQVNAERGLEFKRRHHGENKTELVGDEKFPYWVRLVRRGDTITAYKSPDGERWIETSSGKFELAPRIYIGLGVTSSAASGVNTAVFDNIKVIPALAATAQ